MRHTGFVLAYHGCDQEVGEEILAGRKEIKISTNPWDWLGEGAYFWENSYHRALRWAEFLKNNPEYSKNPIKKPCVVGAILDPGNCLDLTESESLEILRFAHRQMEAIAEFGGDPLPENKSASTTGSSGDLVLRFLDSAVINFLHESRASAELPPFDTVRGAFFEGGPLYEGAKIASRTHIQWAVRNPRQNIFAYFRPRPLKEN